MVHASTATQAIVWESAIDEPVVIRNLEPDPREEWNRMLQFVGLTRQDKLAMSETVEVLFRRGPELVEGVYDYLRSVPETAAILGWEEFVDEAHLEERRRFFTIWLARTLGMDTSEEFADYLFHAGIVHAGHGPRKIFVPHSYVRASMGLVLAQFAQFMYEAQLSSEQVLPAMAGWNKYFSVQLNQMELGHKAATALDEGPMQVTVKAYGVLRQNISRPAVTVHVYRGQTIEDVLRKYFNYMPQARREVLRVLWAGEEKADSLWMDVKPVYVPKPGWRILYQGREIEYLKKGVHTPVKDGDVIDLFPPGR